MEAGRGKPHNKKNTTSSERLAIRLEATGTMKNTSSKSAKIFLRKKIRELREAKLAENRKHNIMTDREMNDALIGFADYHHPTSKVYGGHPRDNNPQTQALERKLATLRRKSEMESRKDKELERISYSLIEQLPTASEDRKSSMSFVYDLFLERHIPLTVKERNAMIDLILNLQDKVATEPTGKNSRAP